MGFFHKDVIIARDVAFAVVPREAGLLPLRKAFAVLGSTNSLATEWLS